MIEKPSSCIGCPFYSYGQYFTPDYMVPGSTVLFIAQNPGADEEIGHLKVSRDGYKQVEPQPFIGATGQLFNYRFLKEAGLKRHEVSVANAIRCRPGTALGLKADALPPLSSKMKLESSKADIVRALKHCRSAYLNIPSTVKTIVTMGSYALYQQTGISNVTDWRGYALDYDASDNFITVDTSYYHDLSSESCHDLSSKGEQHGSVDALRSSVDTSTYHDLSVLQGQQSDNRGSSGSVDREEEGCNSRGANTAVSSTASKGKQQLFVTLHIAALFRDKKYYHATLADFAKLRRLIAGSWPSPLPTFTTNSPLAWPKYAAFDTEYYWDDANRQHNNKLIRWSLCDTDYNLYCVEAENTPYDKIPIESGSTVVIQNALADIAHLSHIVDFQSVSVEDMMLAHSVLWTGEPHSLNYIASVFGCLNRYKHLSVDNPQLYSALDAYEPMFMWRNSFIPDFKADAITAKQIGLPSSWQIYKQYRLPLINIINKAQQTGAALDSARLLEVQQILQARVDTVKQKAKGLVDEQFEIGGLKRVKEEIYG